MIEFTVTAPGAHRVRFAVSPLDELLGALRVALGVRRHPVPDDDLTPAAVAALPIAELLSVLRDPAYVCEFLSPPPSGPDTSPADQLAAVRRTPSAQVAAQLAGPDVDARALPADPRSARDLIADQLDIAWRAVLADRWPQLRALLRADIAHRSGKLAEGGVGLMVAGLGPQLRMVHRTDADAIAVTNTARATVPLDRRGLLLVPSAFTWPRCGVIAIPPWQPSVLYPARGLATPTSRAGPAALAEVVGRTKAALLAALDRPSSTSDLARRLALAPATVSEHLLALRNGGLLTATRRGRTCTNGPRSGTTCCAADRAPLPIPPLCHPASTFPASPAGPVRHGRPPVGHRKPGSPGWCRYLLDQPGGAMPDP